MEFLQYAKVVQEFGYLVEGVCPYLLRADILQYRFSLPRVVPEFRLLGDEFFVFYLNNLSVVVKDTSSRHPRAPLNPSIVLWSYVSFF